MVEHVFPETEPGPPTSRLILALLAAATGAFVGGLAMGFIGNSGLLIPLAGPLAGYAAGLVYPHRSVALFAGVMVLSFFGSVVSETITLDLEASGFTGPIDYFLHFYKNDLGMDWLFRGLNALAGLWFCPRGEAADSPRTDS